MSVNFQQLHRQVKHLGDRARLRERELQEKRRRAGELLQEYAQKQTLLIDKIERVVQRYDPHLRCARPGEEPMNAAIPLPDVPPAGTIIAADGSQINPDRHAEVDFCLINVGAIRLELGSPQAPERFIWSDLFYDERLYTSQGTLTEGMLALLRDKVERNSLLDLAESAPVPPVITFTDGPLELWGARESGLAAAFRETLQDYLKVLEKLHKSDVTTAGYVDKPGANLVLRSLEVGMIPDSNLEGIREQHPLRGVTDRALFSAHLPAGYRSAVFAIQSGSAAEYRDELGLYFFYLNVGRSGRPYLARIEIPAWVAVAHEKLDALHSVLVQQCRILGTRPYPYLLHRAHEAAVVSRDEKEQLTQMIMLELRRRGVAVEDKSPKQASKELGGRGRYV